MTINFTTKCPNLQIIMVDSMGNINYNYNAQTKNNGLTYNFPYSIGQGNRQSISLVDWSGNTSCSWSFNFKLNFKCDTVTDYCYDCSDYNKCLSCINGYFFYQNRCYANLPNCAKVTGLDCSLCNSGYILVDGVCRLCSSFIPDCKSCSSTTVCTGCKVGYALTAGNLGCATCTSFMADCVTCTSSSVCTGCP